jgi:hypothetical protein
MKYQERAKGKLGGELELAEHFQCGHLAFATQDGMARKKGGDYE